MSYLNLLNMKYKTHSVIITIVFVLISLGIFLSGKEIYQVYNTYGYVQGNVIIFDIPINLPDTLNKMEYLKINDDTYTLDDIMISEVLLDEANITNYQEVTLTTKSDYPNNMVLKVTVYHSKEKVITKLKNLIV